MCFGLKHENELPLQSEQGLALPLFLKIQLTTHTQTNNVVVVGPF